MYDDQPTGAHPTEPVARLFRARAARRRAEQMEESARRDLALVGVNGRVVDLAIALLENGLRSHVDEHRAAQQLLRMARAPVQIEVANFYTAPDALTDGSAEAMAFDEGYWARVLGASRTVKARNEAERAAWMRGWDACDADMQEPAE